MRNQGTDRFIRSKKILNNSNIMKIYKFKICKHFDQKTSRNKKFFSFFFYIKN